MSYCEACVNVEWMMDRFSGIAFPVVVEMWVGGEIFNRLGIPGTCALRYLTVSCRNKGFNV